MILYHNPNKAVGAAIRRKKGAASQIRESGARVKVVGLQGQEYVDPQSAIAIGAKRVVADGVQCVHDPPKIATDQYRMQSQSHELFALGLTTSSPTANESEHKQVMEEKIAAFDNKLVKGQKEPSGQDHEANNDGSVKAAAVVVPVSPPEPPTPNELSRQQRNYPAEVHHTQAPQTQPIPFQQGMGMGVFKLNNKPNDGRKQKEGKQRQQTKDNSKVTNNTSLGMKNAIVRKASASPQPIVCQQQSIDSVLSPTAVKQPYNKNLTTCRPILQRSVVGRSLATPKIVQPRCKAFQQAVKTHLEAPCVFYPQSRPERRPPRRNSSNSDHDTYTMATDESMLSLGRSSSPFSEPSSSNPPSFVHLSDLERSKSHDRSVIGSQIATSSGGVPQEQIAAVACNDMDMDDINDNSFSYLDFLNENSDDTAAVSDGTDPHFTAFQSGIMSLDGNTAKAALLKPMVVDIVDDMDIDSLIDSV